MRHFRPVLIALLLLVLTEMLILVTPLERHLAQKIPNTLSDKWHYLNQTKARPIDVLFLGTSQTNNGFRTKIFEEAMGKPITAYNFGIRSGDYYLFQLILERYIQQHGKPKLLLLELNEVLFNKHYYYYSDYNNLHFRTLLTVDLSTAVKILGSPYLSAADKLNITLSQLSALYRYRSLIGPYQLKSIFSPGAEGPLTYEKGWVALETKPIMSDREAQRKFSSEQIDLILSQQNQFDAAKLESFLRYCRQEKIPVVLVKWPTDTIFESLERHEFSRLFRNEAHCLASRYAVPVVDLSRLSDLRRAMLYGDPRHLNSAGATVVSKILAQEIVQLEKQRRLALGAP